LLASIPDQAGNGPATALLAQSLVAQSLVAQSLVAQKQTRLHKNAQITSPMRKNTIA
jgi:hypothetical protein